MADRGQAEGRAHRGALGDGQHCQVVEHRRAQLVEPGEGELHLRFDPAGPGDLEPRRRADGVVEQGGLTDPGLPLENKHATVPVVGLFQQPL